MSEFQVGVGARGLGNARNGGVGESGGRVRKIRMSRPLPWRLIIVRQDRRARLAAIRALLLLNSRNWPV